jgi:hypothetical protein
LQVSFYLDDAQRRVVGAGPMSTGALDAYIFPETLPTGGFRRPSSAGEKTILRTMRQS